MLSHITWGQYWAILILLVAIYYFLIAALFFRQEIAGLFRSTLSHHRPARGHSEEQQGQKDQKTGFDGLEPVVADIKNIMANAGSGADKEQLLAQLKARIASYPGMRYPAFHNAINQYIIRNAEVICGVGFEEDELEAAWDSLPR